MSPRQSVKRSRTRRAGESAYGVLLLTKVAVMALVAAVLIVAGAWTSWAKASVAMMGDVQGQVTIASCGEDTCEGPFVRKGGEGGLPDGESRAGEDGESDKGAGAGKDGEGSPEGDREAGAQEDQVTVAKSVSGEPDQTLDVAVRPGTNEAVRTGPGGVLYAWLPLGGALLLASLVVAGGLRMRRTAVGMGAVGGLTMAAAWAFLTF